MAEPLSEEALRFRRAFNRQQSGTEERLSAPEAALRDSRVDLTQLIRDGIPEPTFIPGGAPWLLAAKRYLIPAPAGTGKSLAGLVVAVNVVKHGGRVIILDVENGSEEYARRYASILTARDRDGSLTAACQERLSYHAWPTLRLDWTAEEWSAAVTGADLVIFDSSRMMLSSVGLDEDSNNDYASFVSAILMPISRAGTTTIVLDNTGHMEKDRARGASTKTDLNEVVYALSVHEPFGDDQAGQLKLIRKRQRFSGLPEELRIDVGGDTYTAPEAIEREPKVSHGSFRPTVNMERVSELVEREPGLGVRDIRRALGGNAESVDLAISLLVAEGFITVRDAPIGSKKPHHSECPYRRANDLQDPDRDPRV